jgi:hypothetical protein
MRSRNDLSGTVTGPEIVEVDEHDDKVGSGCVSVAVKDLSLVASERCTSFHLGKEEGLTEKPIAGCQNSRQATNSLD